MNQREFSPAFSPRSAEAIEFLSEMDGTTGFRLFWIDVVRPLLIEIGARHVLEIGADRGEHTRELIAYCDRCDGHLTVIDPSIGEPLRAVAAGSGRVELLQEKSATALARFTRRIDAVLLEGDLNYATVRADLRALAEIATRTGAPFPLVVVRNTSWPYARRDMYYDPAALADSDRQPYAFAGMTPWSRTLIPGLINDQWANAVLEGGARNGVLSAVEDFVREQSLRLFTLPLNHGLGIMCPAGSPAERFIQRELVPPPALARLLETVEIARLNEIIRNLGQPGPPQPPAGVIARGRHALARVRHKVIGR